MSERSGGISAEKASDSGTIKIAYPIMVILTPLAIPNIDPA